MNHLAVDSSPVGRVADEDRAMRAPEAELYRIRSKAATLSVLFGVLAMAGFLFTIFMLVAPLAMVLGWYGLQVIRRYPHEYMGKGFATVGLSLGALSLFGGSIFHTTIYLTEVREGYERITYYNDLKNKVDLPTERAQALDGQKVFLKGYVRSGLRRKGMTECLFVGDFGDCCFGGSPNLTEVVYVKLPEGKTTQFDYMLRRVHGTFRLNSKLQRGDRLADDVQGYIYEIEADFFD
jgi:hypothetical protein